MIGALVPMGRQRAARSIVLESPLPMELQGLVLQVVRRTRLRGRERADLARELCSHFQEALAAGRSPAEAMAAFGDPRSASAALRRAAVAKRHLLDRACGSALRWSARTLAAVVLAYAAFALYLAFQTPRITFDPLARFREMTPAPTATAPAAWPEVRRALVALGFAGRGADARGVGALEDLSCLPGEPGYPALAAQLEEHRDAVAGLRAAAARPLLGFPVGGALPDEDVPLLGLEALARSRHGTQEASANQLRALTLELPYLGRIRSAVRVLCADAVVAAEAGDGARAVDDLVSALRLSCLGQDFRILIGDLSAISCRALALSRMRMLLEWRPEILSDGHLLRMQEAIHAVPPALQRMDPTAEMVSYDDVLQCMYSDDGAGDGWFRPGGAQLRAFQGLMPSPAPADPGTALRVAGMVGGPITATAVAGRKETREKLLEILKEGSARSRLTMLEATLAGPGAALEAMAKARTDGLLTTRWLVPAFLLPSLERAEAAYRVDRALCDATLAATACERFRRATGAWPSSVTELVPRFLPKLPHDTWSTGPLRLAVAGGTFRLYSVGADRRDNGGVPNTTAPGGAASIPWDWAGDGDLVLFEPRGTLERWVAPGERERSPSP